MELSTRLPEEEGRTWSNGDPRTPLAYTLTSSSLAIGSAGASDPVRDAITVELVRIHRVQLDTETNRIDIEYEHPSGRPATVRLAFSRPEDGDEAFAAVSDRLALSHVLTPPQRLAAAKLPLALLVCVVCLTAVLAIFADVFEQFRRAREAGSIRLGEGAFGREVYLPETPLETLRWLLLPRLAWQTISAYGFALTVAVGAWLGYRVRRAAQIVTLERVR
jgi:hypothetical protein